MRSDLLVAAALVCAGCTSTVESTPAGREAAESPEPPAPPEPPEPPKPPEPLAPPEPPAPPVAPAAAGESVEDGAKAGAMRESLGEAAAVVESATDVKIARLRVIGALHAQAGRLKSDTTIAGYPIEGASQPLAQDARAELVDALLDDSSYQWGLARRCANDYLIGARFTSARAKVEFALGMPCEQAFFVFAAGDDVTSTGQVMTTAAAQRIVDAARAAGLP